MIAIHPNYITDEAGKKISVVLSLLEFQLLIEELEELEDIRLYDLAKADTVPAVPANKDFQMIKATRQKN